MNETGLFLFSDYPLQSFFFFFCFLELGSGKDMIFKLS